MLIKSKVSNSRTLCFLRGLKLKWPFFVYSLLFFITQICHTSFFDRLRGGDEKKTKTCSRMKFNGPERSKSDATTYCRQLFAQATIRWTIFFRFVFTHTQKKKEKNERFVYTVAIADEPILSFFFLFRNDRINSHWTSNIVSLFNVFVRFVSMFILSRAFHTNESENQTTRIMTTTYSR